MAREKKKTKLKRNILIGVLLLIALGIGISLAPNYITGEIKDRTNLILNNNNVTARLKKDVYIDEKGVIYLSLEDTKNYFDKYIYIDKEENVLITTSDTKVGKIRLGETTLNINGSDKRILGTVIKKDDTTYIPLSDMCDVYNIELEHSKETDTITVDSFSRKLTKANVSKNVSIKYKTKVLSKTLDRVKTGEAVVVISTEKGWSKVRSANGKIGYVKEKYLANINVVRDKMEYAGRLDQKVNLVWDYYSEYVKVPNRTGTKIEGINVIAPAFFSFKENGGGMLFDNAGSDGKEYIKWAKENDYKVWAMVSNNSYRTTTSEVLNDYKKREKLIEDILKLAIVYNVDGINLDFENMNESDKDAYSRFVIELRATP